MELQTLFRRESAAGSYSIGIYHISSYSLERLMASPLFRAHSDILAGWKTGSRKVVKEKVGVWEQLKWRPLIAFCKDNYSVQIMVETSINCGPLFVLRRHVKKRHWGKDIHRLFGSVHYSMQIKVPGLRKWSVVEPIAFVLLICLFYADGGGEGWGVLWTIC